MPGSEAREVSRREPLSVGGASRGLISRVKAYGSPGEPLGSRAAVGPPRSRELTWHRARFRINRWRARFRAGFPAGRDVGSAVSRASGGARGVGNMGAMVGGGGGAGSDPRSPADPHVVARVRRDGASRRGHPHGWNLTGRIDGGRRVATRAARETAPPGSRDPSRPIAPNPGLRTPRRGRVSHRGGRRGGLGARARIRSTRRPAREGNNRNRRDGPAARDGRTERTYASAARSPRRA